MMGVTIGVAWRVARILNSWAFFVLCWSLPDA